jgi:hypothetical protein
VIYFSKVVFCKAQVIAMVRIPFRFVLEAVDLFFSKRHIKTGFTCAHRIGDEMMPFGSKIRP